MEKGTKTILGLGFLGLLGWWLFKKPTTPQPTTNATPPPVNTPPIPKVEPRYKVTEDVYFWNESGDMIEFIIPKDTIVTGNVVRDGMNPNAGLSVVTSYGNATISFGSYESVSNDTPLSDKIMLGCFSYKVTNVNNSNSSDLVAEVNYVTCNGEPTMDTIYGSDSVVIDNVIEGSMFSGDPKVLISKA